MASSFQIAISSDPSTLADRVASVLGLELAARAVGVSETRAVRQWIEGERAVKGASTLLRLRTVAQIVEELSADLTPYEIRGWLTVAHPRFNFKSAVQLLEEGPLEDVRAQILAAATEPGALSEGA